MAVEVHRREAIARRSPVLLTGATGFVGRRAFSTLVEAGFEVRCASRSPELAASRYPDRDWVRVDVDDAATLRPAMRGCRSAVYLVHGMATGGDYLARELAAARAFADAAEAEGLGRIVYLGGVAPQGSPSRHLRSRLLTGEILRAGAVPTVELRASMIVGAGGESWRIVRDLATRLPAMVLPRWMDRRSQPIGVDDVIVALREALLIPDEAVGCWDLPGPTVMTHEEILRRIAALRDMEPVMLHVPFLTPRLSSLWLRLVTRADSTVARELILGLTHDLIGASPGFWVHVPGHRLQSFEEAAQKALAEEQAPSPSGRAAEGLARKVSRRVRHRPT